MRKIFTAIVAVFFLVSVILLINEENFVDEVSIITFAGQYSRLITGTDEELSFPVYLSYEESFITESEAIDRASLSDGENIIDVRVGSIRDGEYSEYLDGTAYHLFYYDISFPDATETDYFLGFVGASLELTYQNGDEISLEVGDVFLRFSTIDNPGYVDLYRMYALPDEAEEQTAGIILGLRNMTLNGITLTSIDIGYTGFTIDLRKAAYIEAAPDNYLDLPESIRAVSVEADTVSAFQLDQDKLIWLPIDGDSTDGAINRFPLIITFEYQGNQYRYLVDDFVFYTSDNSLEGNYGRLREFVYRYQ